MKKYPAVFMRGGTSKGLIFKREDLPKDQSLWNDIFLQAMGSPDPKQIDGMGGTVSSNNKVVIVWNSDEENVDIEYEVGQVIVGKYQVDFKSNCGNMTAAVGPFAIEEGMVPAEEPETIVRMLNRNTDKYINISVPVKNGTFANYGNCTIAGVDGTSGELKVNFLNPAGAKTGKLFPTGKTIESLNIEGLGEIRCSILDVSNPMVLIKAEDIGLTGTELPEEINSNEKACEVLEKIRGTAACLMGFAKDLKDASENSPAVPKVGFFTSPKSYTDIANDEISEKHMDLCARVISVFKCHKACPLTSASSISVAAAIPNTIISNELGLLAGENPSVKIGHPSGIMTMYPHICEINGDYDVKGVAVQRTARRIMDGCVYIKDQNKIRVI